MCSVSRITAVSFIALLILCGGVAAAYFVLSNHDLARRNAMLTELTAAKVKSEKADQFKGDLLNYLGSALYDPLSKIATSTDLLLYRSDNPLFRSVSVRTRPGSGSATRILNSRVSPSRRPRTRKTVPAPWPPSTISTDLKKSLGRILG